MCAEIMIPRNTKNLLAMELKIFFLLYMENIMKKNYDDETLETKNMIQKIIECKNCVYFKEKEENTF